MTFSLFDWLLLQLRPRSHGLARTSETRSSTAFAGLTQEEIRQLQRMRAEVRLAREQARLFVSQNRAGML